MRRILVVMLFGLGACSPREHFLFLASESLTGSQQNYYIERAREEDEKSLLQVNGGECGSYPAGLGSFTISCKKPLVAQNFR